MMFELAEQPNPTAVMKVIGVGGAGCNAINRMIKEKVEGVEFISVNTDAQALARSGAETKIQIGKQLTKGLGAGARPGVGREAIEEDIDEVREALQGADLVIVAAGMGGGTGTGAAPIVGEIGRDLGALVVGVVSKPFGFEGRRRMAQAEEGLQDLGPCVDTMVVVPNDRLLSVCTKGTSFRAALAKADEMLLHGTQGISDVIRVTGEVNVDFADVRTVMTNHGTALMGIGRGEGEERATTAAKTAIECPLLDNLSINGAKGVLINITGGDDLTMEDVWDVAATIQKEAGDEAEIIFGSARDSDLEGKVHVTVIATGFETMKLYGSGAVRNGSPRSVRVAKSSAVRPPQRPRTSPPVASSADIRYNESSARLRTSNSVDRSESPPAFALSVGMEKEIPLFIRRLSA